MKKAGRKYTREFKVEAVRLHETTGQGVTQSERHLDIRSGCPWHWKRKFSEDGQGGLTPEQEHILQLKRKNEILRQE